MRHTLDSLRASALVVIFSVVTGLAGNGDSLRILLVDAASQEPIADRTVRVWETHVVYCVRAPCPPVSSVLWTGRTSSTGVAVVPWSAVKEESSVEMSGYVRQPFKASRTLTALKILMTVDKK